MTFIKRPYSVDYFSFRLLNKFDTGVLNAVWKIPNRMWNNTEKSWLIPYNLEGWIAVSMLE